MSNILTNNINSRSGNKITIGDSNDTVSIPGTLTYEDVTNIDSVGVVTAQSGIHVTGGSVGIGTDNPGRVLHVLKSQNIVARFESTTAVGGIELKDANTTGDFKVQLIAVGDDMRIDAGGSERMRIKDGGNFGIGTTNPAAKLHIQRSDSNMIRCTNTGEFGSSDISLIGSRNVGGEIGALKFLNFRNASSPNDDAEVFASVSGISGSSDVTGTSKGGDLSFNTRGLGSSDVLRESLRLTSTSNVYMGNYFEAVDNLRDAQTTIDRQAKVQIVGGSAPAASLALVSYADGGSGYYSPHLWLAKSDTNTTGNNNLVADGEDLGSICFAGNDGTRFLNASAIITEVDGSPSNNDMPGRLEFHVCANGASTLTERFRIQNNGNLLATDTTIGSLSDSRLKTNISDFTYDLELFKQFQPRTFDWINPELHDNVTGQRGFIAQEIESVDATYVFESKIKESSDDSQLVGDDNVAKSAKLGKNDAMYISVIQQLISKIETLETQNADLVTRIEALEQA